MKKVWFTVLALIATVVFVGCSGINDFSSRGGKEKNTVTYKTSPEIYKHVKLGYNQGIKGPITITQGVLKVERKTHNIYLVGLSGTETGDTEELKAQSTDWFTDLQSGFCLDNEYLDAVVEAITENIPENSNIMFTGHSLGGMVAQQAAANKTLKNKYNILYTLTFGSPLLAAGSREGSTIRLGDTNDVVPYLSGSLFNNTIWAIAGLNRESGGYKLTDFEAAHCESYERSDVWGKYDAIGKKNGKATITLDLDTLNFYHAENKDGIYIGF